MNFIYKAPLNKKKEFTRCKQETLEDDITEQTLNSQVKHEEVSSKVS